MAKVTRTAGPGAEKLRTLLQGLGNKATRVGFAESAKYEDGTPVAYVAAIQEFGDPSHSIPPRPFMRPTVDRDTGTWKATATQGAQAILAGKSDSATVMDAIGQQAAGGIRKSITLVQSPPLSYTTLLLRKQKRGGTAITGKSVGEAFRSASFVGPRTKGDKTGDVSGVSTKPLVFDGILLGSVTSTTTDA